MTETSRIRYPKTESCRLMRGARGGEIRIHSRAAYRILVGYDGIDRYIVGLWVKSVRLIWVTDRRIKVVTRCGVLAEMQGLFIL